MLRVLIVGAGGHAQVVADILLAQSEMSPLELIGFVDDRTDIIGTKILGRPILATIAERTHFKYDQLVVAIGHNSIRAQLFEKLNAEGEQFVAAVHPRAVVAPDVVLGEGCMLSAGAIVNTGSQIGPNTIINTGATVDHHNEIGQHAHIAPGVHFGGDVQIGEGTLVGIGATIMPQCTVGAWSTIGAGSVVIEDVPANTTVVGNPARRI